MSLSTSAKQTLLTEIQTRGIRLLNDKQAHVSRKGGAGPSDHQAIIIDNTPVMVPVYTHSAGDSPFTLDDSDKNNIQLLNDHIPLTDITYAKAPEFYGLKTADGIPYSHIATLHSTDVLATTVLQNCIRYDNPKGTCKFCSIGASLTAGQTIAHKTPEQLAEVAKAAVELDGIKHMVMTTGTPNTQDRGAQILCDSVKGVKAAVDIPIQVQCEPPKDLSWLQRLKDAGADALGLHLEVVTPEVRDYVMPSKAKVSVDEYMEAFKIAVPIFGRGQVSTYILAGLGDTEESILAVCDELLAIGVYPFVVPFVPISGTAFEHRPPPSTDFMKSILEPLGKKINAANLRAEDIKAGCGRCGACSSLSSYESDK